MNACESHVEMNRRHFSASAAGYDFDRGQINVRLYRAKYALRQLAKHGVVKDMKVLDVGCSEGLALRTMAPYIREGIGIDIAPLPIMLAKERALLGGLANLSFQECAAEQLEDHDFDAAVCFETIEHVPDPVDFLQAIRVCLRPAGVLVLSTPNYSRLLNRLIRLRGKSPQVCDPTHFREYTAPELAAIATDAGFRVQRQSGMMLFDSSLMYYLLRRCMPPKPLKSMMESAISIHLGRFLKSLAFVQLMVAVKDAT